MWSILTEPSLRRGKWDQQQFFASGQAAVDAIMAQATRLGVPEQSSRALDFGCGVGRLTRALAGYFEQADGLDIAETMIRRAVELNADIPGCAFRRHDDTNLRAFADRSFDLVCSIFVLQHIPSRELIDGYMREFVRVLRPSGLLVLELPTALPSVPPPTLRTRIAPRTRLTRSLRRLGVSPKFLYEHLDWRPDMPMTAVTDTETIAILSGAGARLLHASEPVTDFGGVQARFYYATR
jgi:ubiquinone/menaquinone biosynthesis C-methylase UbiE